MIAVKQRQVLVQVNRYISQGKMNGYAAMLDLWKDVNCRYKITDKTKKAIDAYSKEIYNAAILNSKENPLYAEVLYFHNIVFPQYANVMTINMRLNELAQGKVDFTKEDLLDYIKGEFSNWYNAATAKPGQKVDAVVVTDSEIGLNSMLSGYNAAVGMELPSCQEILEMVIYSNSIWEIMAIQISLYLRLKNAIKKDGEVFFADLYHKL